MCFSKFVYPLSFVFQLLFLAFAQCARLSILPHLIHSLCFSVLSSSWSLLIKLFPVQINLQGMCSFSLSQVVISGPDKEHRYYQPLWWHMGDQTKVVCKAHAYQQRFTPLARATEGMSFSFLLNYFVFHKHIWFLKIFNICDFLLSLYLQLHFNAYVLIYESQC